MSFDPTGYTLAHEHLHIDLSSFKNNMDCHLDQYAFICQEMNNLMTQGMHNVIEMTNHYMGHNAQFMLDVMHETGINMVACTSYYQDTFFPEHVATHSMQELAQEMVNEIEQGINGTELKARIITEISTSKGKITPLEEKVFIATALAHNQTRHPISTHTSFSTMGLEQLALLQAHRVDLSHITIGHCNLKDNLNNILKIINLSTYMQFNTISKNSYYPDKKHIAMLHALHDHGLLNHVMLSMDITRHSHLKANSGYGYDYLLTTFIPQLHQSGFSQANVDVMLHENPSQFFQ